VVLSSSGAYIFVRSSGVWTQQQKVSSPVILSGVQVAISGDTVAVGARVFVRNGGTWTQQQEVTAADADAGFGQSVALSGDTLVVGAANSGAFGMGNAHVFVRSSGVWSRQQKLTASDATLGANFGVSADIDGDTIVVGAQLAAGNASQTGAAYVFLRSGGVWSQQAKLTASDGETSDSFGIAVAISGDTVVVGSDQASLATFTGAAYVFVRSSGVWTQQQRITASDAVVGSGERFAHSVGISLDTLVAGAQRKTSFQGAAYIYTASTVPTTVSIDIKPGDLLNGINRRSPGIVQVALLSSPTFDATKTELDTVLFAGASPVLLPSASPRNIGFGLKDVNNDGLLDAVFRFDTQSLDLQDGATQACLTGSTIDGEDFKGCDSVTLIR
jgi:hypothetical protein